jgi:phage-related protein
MTYTGTLATSDVLIIDTEYMTAKVGTSNALANYNGVFPKLQVGNTAVTADSNVTIKWNNRWI